MRGGEREARIERSKYSRIEPWLYLSPFLIGIALFTLYPIVNVFMISFQENYSYLSRSFSGVGLANYRAVLSDRNFFGSIRNTFVYVLTVVPISTAIALVVANLLNQKLKATALFQTAYFLPMVTSVTAVGLSWRFMFHTRFGVINYLLSLFGAAPIGWLDKPAYNMTALAIYGIWNVLPFTIILLISGLQNVNPLYYTAARVDGAKGGRVFLRITIPLLAPTIGLVLIINSISSFKVFNELFPLFKGNPGPVYNLYTLVFFIYEKMNGQPPKLGQSAAAAIALFVIILIFTMVQLLIQRKWKHY